LSVSPVGEKQFILTEPARDGEPLKRAKVTRFGRFWTFQNVVKFPEGDYSGINTPYRAFCHRLNRFSNAVGRKPSGVIAVTKKLAALAPRSV
jgi:hypothetical protein